MRKQGWRGPPGRALISRNSSPPPFG